MFGGFTESDFDAYAEHKWRSNAFSLERLAVKEKLVALGRELTSTATGANGSALHSEPSTEHPALWNQKRVDAQHLFFTRARSERDELDRIIERSRSLASLIEDPSPQRSHLVLAVSIDATRLSAALRLHTDATIDRRNLQQKTRDAALRGELIRLLSTLPEPFGLAVGNLPPTPAHSLDERHLDEVLTELGQPLGPGKSRWLSLSRELSRPEVLALGAGVVAEVRDSLAALVPIFRFIAWTPDNDHIGLRKELHAEAEAKRHRGLARNDRVRVVSGIFAGRIGTVQELDPRGGLKVLIGKIPIVVDAQEVEKL